MGDNEEQDEGDYGRNYESLANISSTELLALGSLHTLSKDRVAPISEPVSFSSTSAFGAGWGK